MIPLDVSFLLIVATSGAADAFSGSWCGEEDYAIWIGETEAVLGVHAFCRLEPPVKRGPSHIGTLFCRTTQEKHADSVELVNHVALEMDYRVWMTISYFGADRTTEPYSETLRPC